MADLEDVTLDGRPLQSLRVADLKAALEERGLSKSGQKNALIKRLKGALMLENLQRTSTAHIGLQPNSQIGEEMSQNSFIKQYLAKQQELLRQRLEREAREAYDTNEEEDHTEVNNSTSCPPQAQDVTPALAEQHKPPGPSGGEGFFGTVNEGEANRNQEAHVSGPPASGSVAMRVPGGSASNEVAADSDDEDSEDGEEDGDDDDWDSGARRRNLREPARVPTTRERSGASCPPQQQHMPSLLSPQLRQPTPPPSPPPELSFPLPDTPKQSPPSPDVAPPRRSPSTSSSGSSSSGSRSSSPEPQRSGHAERKPGPLTLLARKMASEGAFSGAGWHGGDGEGDRQDSNSPSATSFPGRGPTEGLISAITHTANTAGHVPFPMIPGTNQGVTGAHSAHIQVPVSVLKATATEDRDRKRDSEIEREKALELERQEKQRKLEEERERALALEREERERALEKERIERQQAIEREEREKAMQRERELALERERQERELALAREREEREKALARERALELERQRALEQERLQREKEERERLQREKEERERLQREKEERERLQREKEERERLQREKEERERLQREKEERERLQREKEERERLQKEKEERERQEREEQERAEQERKERERALELERERALEAERKEKERLEREKALEQERLERERLEREKALEQERIEREKALEQERLERERIEREKALEQERLEKERALEQERLERERALEQERLEQERVEREKALERERIEREKAEQERIEREKALEQERLDRERAQEQERLELERKEKERIEREKALEQERIEREKALEREREEKERVEREERERLEKERAEKERIERLEREKALEQEKLERERALEKERQEKKRALEQERERALERERVEKEKAMQKKEEEDQERAQEQEKERARMAEKERESHLPPSKRGREIGLTPLPTPPPLSTGPGRKSSTDAGEQEDVPVSRSEAAESGAPMSPTPLSPQSSFKKFRFLRESQIQPSSSLVIKRPRSFSDTPQPRVLPVLSSSDAGEQQQEGHKPSTEQEGSQIQTKQEVVAGLPGPAGTKPEKETTVGNMTLVQTPQTDRATSLVLENKEKADSLKTEEAAKESTKRAKEVDESKGPSSPDAALRRGRDAKKEEKRSRRRSSSNDSSSSESDSGSSSSGSSDSSTSSQEKTCTTSRGRKEGKPERDSLPQHKGTLPAKAEGLKETPKASPCKRELSTEKRDTPADGDSHPKKRLIEAPTREETQKKKNDSDGEEEKDIQRQVKETAMAEPEKLPETSDETPKAFSARKISLSGSKSSPGTGSAEGEQDSGAVAGRKRRWGSSTAVTAKKPSISITTDSLKSLIPDIRPCLGQEAVVDLHPEEAVLSGAEDEERERSDQDLQIRRTVTQVVHSESQENGQKEAKRSRHEELGEDDLRGDGERTREHEEKMDTSFPGAMETQSPSHTSHDVEINTVTPSDTLIRRSISQQKTGVSITIDDPVRTARQPSPPRGKVSSIVHICNLVRPFTLGQLKELLGRTGTLVEEGFWIDKIKSHCYVTYCSSEEAVATRAALHGVKWPQSNPKVLSVDFCQQEELDFHKGLGAADRPGAEDQGPGSGRSRASGLPSLLPERDQWAEREREMERRERARAEREWDRDKVREFGKPGDEKEGGPRRSRSRERRRKERGKSKEKKTEKKEKTEDPPAKLLDDLFRKTKAAPCIYWLPLTEEQFVQREAARAERTKEREKRRKEQEEEEEKKREEERKERMKAGGGAAGDRSEGEKDKDRDRERDRDRDRGRDRDRERERERENDKRRDGYRRPGGSSAGGGRRSRSRSDPRERRR